MILDTNKNISVQNRLKELRKAQKWSQAELARRLDISRQAVNGFESGKFTPSLEMAFKIASLFDAPIETIFLYQRQNIMQTLVEKIDNFTQWLPKGERFTDEAIQAIAIAQKHAATLGYERVEPENMLYGLSLNPSSKASELLAKKILDLKPQFLNLELKNARITQFSEESKYILEQALNIARLNRHKDIKVEYIAWGLIQLTELKNS